jgi:hypothetical protein
MGDGNSFMAVSSLVQGASSFAGANSQSEAIKAQGQYQSNQLDFNAKLSDIQAKNALDRGSKNATSLKRRAKVLAGSQRAAAAAQGIEVGSGSAADIQADTATFSNQDAQEIRNNAWREAWGYNVEAMNLRSQARMARSGSEFAAKQTLLTGGIQAANYGMQAGYYSSLWAEDNNEPHYYE